MTLTATHIKAARLWLGWDQRDLAQHASISLPTVQRIEMSDDQVRGQFDTIERVRRCLEGAGIEFIYGNAPGVRLHPGPACGFVSDPSAPGGVRPAFPS